MAISLGFGRQRYHDAARLQGVSFWPTAQIVSPDDTP
jgi:hypothetical protein